MAWSPRFAAGKFGRLSAVTFRVCAEVGAETASPKLVEHHSPYSIVNQKSVSQSAVRLAKSYVKRPLPGGTGTPACRA